MRTYPRSRVFLPGSWWKLSFLWLVNLKDRSPPLKNRSLFRQSLRSAIFGMALGVLALSLTLGIVTGFQWALAQAVNRSVGTVSYFTQWRRLEDFQQILRAHSQDLVKAESFWTTQGLLTGPRGGRGVLIEGRRRLFPAESAAPAQEIPAHAISNDPSNEIRVEIGSGLAGLLGVKEGDLVRLLLPGLLPGSVAARVSRLLHFGMYEIDTRTVVVDDLSLVTYLQKNDPETLAKRPGDAHGLRFYLTPDYLRPGHNTRLDVWVEGLRSFLLSWPLLNEERPVIKTWQDQRKNLFGSIGMDKGVLVVVLSLITLVAALNVAATLVVLYLERDRDLAILRSLGMSRWQLVEWLGIQGLGVGIFSVTIGLAASWALGSLLSRFPIIPLPAEIYNLSALPFHMDFWEQAGVAFWGLVACFGVSVGLGWRLSRQKSLSVLGYRR